MEDRWYFFASILIIIFILAVALLSQQHFLDPIGEKVYSWTSEKVGSQFSMASDWFKKNIYPRVIQEAQDRGEPLKKEAITQKDNAVKTIWNKIKNYFAETFSKISGTKVE